MAKKTKETKLITDAQNRKIHREAYCDAETEWYRWYEKYDKKFGKDPLYFNLFCMHFAAMVLGNTKDEICDDSGEDE